MFILKLIKIELQYFRIIMAIYSVVIFLIKFSILLQYLRVFLPLKQHNAMFWTCHALIWLNLVLYLLFLFFTIFSCKPINKYWNPFISGNCLNTFAINVISPLINTTSDIVIVILPQPIIWNLQISFKKKIGLSTIILVGVLWVEKTCWILKTTAYADISACVSSALRANYVIKILHTDDGTYSMFMIGLFSLFEIAFGFLAACLPVTPKFFESFRNLHIWSSLNSSFHSIIHSKTDSRIFGAQSGKSKAAKLGDGSNRFHAALTDFNSLPNEIEPATENKNGEITQDNRQIMRTVHIATTHEVNTASNKPDFDNQASGISYGYRWHEYPPMQSPLSAGMRVFIS